MAALVLPQTLVCLCLYTFFCILTNQIVVSRHNLKLKERSDTNSVRNLRGRWKMVKVFKPKWYKKRKADTQYPRKFPKSRRFRSDASNYSGRMPLVRSPDYGFPDKLRTRLRYADTFALNGSAVNNVFRMNGCYDPDLTNSGHQPCWFDQLCGSVGSAPYYKYRVLGSKIKVTFTTSSAPSLAAANVGPTLVFINPSNIASLTYGNAVGVMENSGSKYAILQDKSGGSNSKTLTLTYSPQKDLGLSAGDDTIGAAYNANPSAVYYAHVGKIDQGANASNTQIYVEVEYYVEFFQRNEAPQS